ncbi:type I-E CRISPR-associated protein Cse1/CasA [Paucidesulfovibrio longus]|uniref:type I-E CRISPR-associated protein Cse1/CasA n=1 Tax=Paucidesulfovibrio longus TaxID=889 RepID=UPI0003B6FD64|nr:type I-E CRISPR-associated protein Cse1/CasA [Paucidesulfovibrio longus]
MFNLLEERWLPIVRADGSEGVIAPWELAAGDNPPKDLAPPRPDFRAALMEFLVGLLQTVRPPETAGEWERLHEEPPAPDELRAAMEPHKSFFNLFGERPLFMQDFELPPGTPKDANDVAALLIDSPGGNTLKNSGDFFIKRGFVKAMCPACAAMALFTLQTFAPSGGKGHRTSLRGGGPLSTLVEGGTLWEKVWRNVLPQNASVHEVAAAPGPDGLAGAVYPWGAPTRTSEKGEETHPGDVHPLHAYWGMPRRILLIPDEEAGPVQCDLCAASSRTVVRRYVTRPSGYNYGGTWRHPLTPYRHQGQDKDAYSVKGMANIAGYSHWLGVVYGQFDDRTRDGKGIARAACVANAMELFDDPETRELLAEPEFGLTVRASGFDMDNMKARQWCESEFPAYHVPEERLADFRLAVDMFVAAADQVRRNLVGALKDALVHEAAKSQAKIDATVFDNAGTAFWGATEKGFYHLTRRLAECEDYGEAEPFRIEWADILAKTAVERFHAEVERFQVQPERIKRQVQAWRSMRNFNRAALAKILELPTERGSK